MIDRWTDGRFLCFAENRSCTCSRDMKLHMQIELMELLLKMGLNCETISGRDVTGGSQT